METSEEQLTDRVRFTTQTYGDHAYLPILQQGGLLAPCANLMPDGEQCVEYGTIRTSRAHDGEQHRKCEKLLI